VGRTKENNLQNAFQSGNKILDIYQAISFPVLIHGHLINSCLSLHNITLYDSILFDISETAIKEYEQSTLCKRKTFWLTC